MLADSSRFGRRAFVEICGPARMSVLITDAEPPEDLAAALAEAEVEVQVVDYSPGTGVTATCISVTQLSKSPGGQSR